MFKMRVLAQRIFLCIFFVISNVENHKKIAFMKIKKKCRAGAKCRARWDQNHLIFFTWPYFASIFLRNLRYGIFNEMPSYFQKPSFDTNRRDQWHHRRNHHNGQRSHGYGYRSHDYDYDYDT